MITDGRNASFTALNWPKWQERHNKLWYFGWKNEDNFRISVVLWHRTG